MVRATERDDVPPLPTLDYAPPTPRKASGRETIWGVFISIFLANGVGWIAFGALMMNGQRDDHAGPVAIGVAFVILALGLLGTMYVTRRFPSGPG